MLCVRAGEIKSRTLDHIKRFQEEDEAKRISVRKAAGSPRCTKDEGEPKSELEWCEYRCVGKY